MKTPETSIIIRAKNEERWIKQVLEKLFAQTYKDFEVIVIDSGSSDETLSIVSKFSVKVVNILPEEFSYPHALNVGVENSKGKKYIAILSAHSVPISNTWLEDGIRHFSRSNVLGVYGSLKALPDSTVWDKLYHSLSYIKEKIHSFPRGYRIIKKGGIGVLGFTNAIIRKDLWFEHNFNEEYGYGGEDGEWLNYWIERGYIAVKDLKVSVYHSHYLNLNQWQKQITHWRKISKPISFKKLSYRTGNTHK